MVGCGTVMDIPDAKATSEPLSPRPRPNPCPTPSPSPCPTPSPNPCPTPSPKPCPVPDAKAAAAREP